MNSLYGFNAGCSNCPIGLQRCHYPVGTTTRQVCCNYFHQGVCVTDCPSPLVPSAKFDCGKYVRLI